MTSISDAPSSAMALVRTLGGPSWSPDVRSRRDVLRLTRLLDRERDFLIFLVGGKSQLLDIWRLPRSASAPHGFPLAMAVRLAVRARAGAMILVECRDAGDMVPRTSDAELCGLLRLGLAETGTELLDHLLISGNEIASVTGP